MSEFSWPTGLHVSTVALAWIDNTAVFVSPLSGTTRTESRPGGRWSLQMTIEGLTHKAIQSNPLHELEAFLFKLNGKEHRAVIPDVSYQRSGPGTGYNPPTIVPSVFGAGQTGLSLSTNGWAYSTTVLYAGDRIGVSGQMIPLTADATSNGSGAATLSLAHPIRVAVANGTPLELTAPTARYVLANNASFNASPGKKTVLVEFEEAIP